ncbi:MAG: hypothetical protein M1824_004917 [Vezdaea acicularis]|nr:MAG: hypothetical protein M1824_004917 [Vezdaea acicularis]
MAYPTPTTEAYAGIRLSSITHRLRAVPVIFDSTSTRSTVTEILQGNGHNNIATTSYNRFSNSAQRQFYASSAPSSSAALRQQQNTTRPQVPLFPKSTGDIHESPNKSSASPNQGTSSLGNVAMSRSVSAPLNNFHTAGMELLDFSQLGTGLAGNATFESDPTFNFGLDTISASTATTRDDGTVSPQDIFRDPVQSAPPSSAFTNLTSPSFDSPDMNDSYEVSPYFYPDSEVQSKDWYPLFESEQGTSDDSPSNPVKELFDPSISTRKASESRRQSSPGQSPHGRSGHAKHSSISGVSSRKRDKPLPDIRPEDQADPVSAKRVRNTLAARKSRAKKMERVEFLEGKIAELQRQNEQLQGENENLRNLALENTGRIV